MTTKAYSYARFSNTEQARGDSLRRQQTAADEWATANSLEIDTRLTDAGLSAYHGRHRSAGAFGGFLAAVESGDVPRGSVLIVESLDRLSREDAQDAFDQLSALTKAGIEIVTLADGQRYSRDSIRRNPMQLMMSLVIMMRANEESARKSDRLSAVWSQKKRAMTDGKALSRMVVGWCQQEGDRYVLIPERAALVRRIFDMNVLGIGLKRIARIFNSEGVPAWGRAVNGWQPSYIAKILTNRTVLGSYQPRRYTRDGRILDGDEVPDAFPRVVSDEIFYAAQAGRRERLCHPGGGRGKGGKNLLAGIVYCSCGSRMQLVDKGRPPKGRLYLVCDSLKRGRGCIKQSGWWSYQTAESMVFQYVRNIDFAAVADADASAASTATAAAAGLKASLRKAESRRAALLTAFDGDSDAGIVAEIRAAAQEVATLKERHRDAVESANITRATAKGEGHAEVLTRMIERIEDPNETARLEARVAVAQELRRTIERLEFHAKRINVIYKRPDRRLVGFEPLRYAAHTLGNAYVEPDPRDL